MESINFSSFIHSLIKDVMNNDYKTIGDLNLIIGKLDNLPEMIKINHTNAINIIKMTIRSLCKERFDFHILTTAQTDTLLFTLTEVSKSKIKYTRNTLSTDDMVMALTTVLLTDLNHIMLSSNISNYINNYLEILEMALLEDRVKYNDIYDDILVMLERQGWKNGFQREPNQSELVKHLSEIVDKYLYQ